jgi:predicted transcriptional regulator
MEIELHLCDANLLLVLKALCSETRIKILKQTVNEINVIRIAKQLQQTEANVSAQIKILEKAGLVVSIFKPGNHGVSKIAAIAFEKITISL